jgi:hypothetical protein
MNPFQNRALSLSGPATDIIPVVPSDATDLTLVAPALYVTTGGLVSIVTVAGVARQVLVADFSILPVGVRRVNATGTTASGIHALVLA